MRTFVLIAFFLLTMARLSPAFGQNTYYFPQAANGNFPGGSLRTTLVLANPGDTASNVTVRITDDAGNPLSLLPGLESGSLTLGPGNSRTFLSDGSGPLVSGAVSITSTTPIGATVIFSQFDGGSRLQTEAGVTSARLLRAFTIPVDLSGSYNTGVAFFKPGSGGAGVSLTLYDENGNQKGQGQVALSGNGHRSAFVPDFIAGLSGFGRGSLVVSSDTEVAAVALRTGSGAGPVITTLPVADAQSSYYFPQVANGSFPGGRFKTTLILNNSGTAAADVTVRVTGDNGSPLSLFPGIDRDSVTLPPRTTRVFQSDGTGALMAGAATITAGNPIVAAVIFSQYDADGNLQTEAGVTSAPRLQALTIPVDLSNPFNTGVALLKIGSGSANVMMRLLDAGGVLKGFKIVTLGADGHMASFVPDLFPSLRDFDRGSLSVTSANDLAAIALRTGAGAGPIITTLPVIGGAYIPSDGPYNTGIYARLDYPVGEEPIDIVTADFNQDGLPDLAIANHRTNDVTILLARPDGRFDFYRNYPTGGLGVSAVAVGDFNRDGKPDLVVCMYNSDAISVFLGNGAGGFTSRQSYRTGSGPHSVTTGDFNGDGISDVAVVNDQSGTVSVYLGNPDGTLGARRDYSVGGSPHSTRAADINRDGQLDLLIVNLQSNNMSVLLGVGDGTFAIGGTFPTGEGPHGLVIADFNNTGIMDVVTANTDSNDVSYLRGRGDGAFEPAAAFPVGERPPSVMAYDFNMDGRLDVITANFDSGTLSILIGHSERRFLLANTLTVGSGANAVVLGDFNRDGLQDIAVVNYLSNTVSVLMRRPPGAP